MFLRLTWTPIFSVYILFRPPRVCYDTYKLIFTVEVIFIYCFILFLSIPNGTGIVSSRSELVAAAFLPQ